MPQWRASVTMSGSPHGGPGAGNLIVRTKLGCSVQVGGIPVGGDWQAALCPGFHYSSTQVTDFTAVILLALTCWEPSNNSRQVGIANPGGNTKEKIALSASFRPLLTTRINWESRVCRAGRIKIKALRWILPYLYHACCFSNPIGQLSASI